MCDSYPYLMLQLCLHCVLLDKCVNEVLPGSLVSAGWLWCIVFLRRHLYAEVHVFQLWSQSIIICTIPVFACVRISEGLDAQKPASRLVLDGYLLFRAAILVLS